MSKYIVETYYTCTFKITHKLDELNDKKLSEIENQFQELTNKFEKINFKIDKLSSRLSKVQADNQMRFQELENSSTITTDENKKITSLPKEETKKVLPGSSEPQDLG